MDKNLAELKVHVDRLKHLLDDPQPGLVTWCLMFGKTIQSITNWWSKEDKPNE